jgi:hypothetical protein
MSKWAWFGFAVLLANTALAGWMGWQRYRLASSLDTVVVGTVVTAEEVGGRSPHDVVVAKYSIGGESYTVSGNSRDSSKLSVRNHPLGSPIDVFVSSKEPSKAALVRKAGYAPIFIVAALLLVASLAVIFFAIAKKK